MCPALSSNFSKGLLICFYKTDLPVSQHTGGLMERSRPVDCVVLLLASGPEPEVLSGTFNSGGGVVVVVGSGRGRVGLQKLGMRMTSNNSCGEVGGRLDLESRPCLHSPLAALPGWLSAQSSKGASVIPQGSHCRSAPRPEWPRVQ